VLGLALRKGIFSNIYKSEKYATIAYKQKKAREPVKIKISTTIKLIKMIKVNNLSKKYNGTTVLKSIH
jgi:hypothetical protein